MKMSILLIFLILAGQAPVTNDPPAAALSASGAPGPASPVKGGANASKTDESNTTITTAGAEPITASPEPRRQETAAPASGVTVDLNERWPDAIEIYHIDFSDPFDVNFDHWPDGWTRKRGPGFPLYLPIQIEEDPTATFGRGLKIQLDGAGASVYSPPILVDARFSYVLVAKIKTKGLVHDRALLSVDLYDPKENLLETFKSTPIQTAEDWTRVTIGPFAPHSTDVEKAVIGLHLHPTDGRDLTGAAMFDEIWFARLPRMTLDTNRESNVYTDPTEVRVTCRLSGILERDPEIRFELLDAAGRTIKGMRDRLDGRIITQKYGGQIVAQKSSRASDLLGGAKKPAGYEGTAEWNPKLGKNDFGFYRVRVTMTSSGGKVDVDEATLAVVRPPQRGVHGEFGWTLPKGENPLSLDVLMELCPHVGINWLKFPVWYGHKDPDRGDRLMRFAERLSARNIEIVGMLDQPPPEIRTRFAAEGPVSAANIFASDHTLWFDSLDPVMTRLSLKIRWWQLGNDHDTSFVGFPDLQDKITEIRKHLYRFGQDVRFGFGWKWLTETLSDANPPWEFLTRSTDQDVPAFTGSELATYLDHSDNEHALRWIVVEPLSREKYPMEIRARDLVEQMISAKIHRADAIFVANPFDSKDEKNQTGLMNEDGTPGELLLPWRTAALTLRGTTYLGSVRMPGGSTNHIFTRDEETFMIVWNDTPQEEVIYLGDDVELVDIWGRATKPKMKEHRQVVPVGPLPTFITGVSKPVAEWRMATHFDHVRMPSIFGKPHRNALTVKNFFKQGVKSEVRFMMPPSWRFNNQKKVLKLAVGEQYSEPLDFRLPIDASSGLQDVRIDFDVNVDRRYQFSVYRDLEIGLGDVEIEATARLDADGILVIEQIITNNSERLIDFKCYLSVDGRRRQRNQVFRLGRGQDKKYYYYPDGKELLGKWFWLRAEEIRGQRILNVRFQAEE